MAGLSPRFFQRMEPAKGMALPIVLALLAIAMMSIAVTSVFRSHADEESVARQQNLVTHLIEDQQHGIRREQEDMVIWESAAQAVGASEPDLDFLDENLGTGAFEFFGHDEIYILNPRLNAIYAMRDGEMVPAPAYETRREALAPLAVKLREIDWRGALDAFTTGQSDAPPHTQDTLLIDGKPAIVSAMPIISDKVGQSIAPGREHIHIAVQYLDEKIAAHFDSLLLLDSGTFTTQQPTDNNFTAVAVNNTNGDAVAYFVWEPYLPSAGAIERSVPIIVLAIAFSFALISTLMFRLYRSTKQLQAGRTDAQRMAYHDALTGLGNRLLFEKSMLSAITSLNKKDAQAVAFLMLDLDRFKQVNDSLGHEAGDELIREVAARLRPLVRAEDTIVRLGGDEFGIVMHGVTSTDDLGALSNRILNAIRTPFELRAGQAFVGVSIGIAVTRDPNADPIELTREADIALYEAKEGGRNQFRIFEEYMSEIVQSKQSLEADLRAALRTDDQLSVGFEPLTRQSDGKIIGTAASIDWHHPVRGVVPTEDFLPLAETCGLVEIIGDFVLHEACLAGARAPGQFMSVQIFAAQLRNPGFFDRVFSTLHKTGMRPIDLELELDEKTLATSEENIVSALRKFRHSGIRIALGDFGTGFTSLRLLQKYNVDRIKLDRAFLTELEQSPDPEAITHAVIWLARTIGVEVSADGVDTADKKDFLARMGCMSFQGDLFSSKGQADTLRSAVTRPKEHAAQLDADPDFTDVELWNSAS